MRKSIEDYVQKCDPCQRRKEKGEFVAPLGNQEKPKQPFQVLSIDLTGPYPVTARGNKYFLTFIYIRVQRMHCTYLTADTNTEISTRR